jgi:signal transduction histidine kinase
MELLRWGLFKFLDAMKNPELSNAVATGEVAGSFLLGLIESFHGVHSLPQGGMNLRISEIDPAQWYPHAMLIDALNDIEQALPSQNVLFRAGVNFLRIWYEHGPGKTMIHSGLDWLRANDASGGYNSVVRGGSRDEIGWCLLQSIDAEAGIAVFENVMPLSPDFVKGVFYGGCILFDDMEYVDVEAATSPYVPNPSFNRSVLTVRFRLKPKDRCLDLEERIGRLPSGATLTLTPAEVDSLIWRYKGLQVRSKLDFAYHNDVNTILAAAIIERNRTGQALHETMERLKAAASAGIIGVWDWDIANDRLIWDKVMHQLHGLREEDFAGTYEAWLSAVHPDEKLYVHEEIQAALRGEYEYAPEFRVVWPDSSIHYIKAMSHTTFDVQGKPLRMIGVNYDVTEQKNIEQVLEARIAERTRELQKARDAAEAANVAKSAFLANMSHEMRTPLHHISGMSELIRRESLSPKQQNWMAMLSAACQNLTALIDVVLDLTKFEAGQFDPAEEPFSLEALLADVISVSQASAAAKQLELVAESFNAPAKVQGGKEYIKKALLNYVNNAIRFADKGAISIRLKLAADVGDHVLIRFEVEDAGPGIEPQNLPRLFSIFEQVDNSSTRKFGGLGMGLAMTKKIAEIMGGEVGCDSTPGVCSLFWFTARLKKA